MDQFILWIFISATAVQLFFWLFFFARLAFYKTPPTTNHQSPVTNHQSPITSHQSPIPVSIIICARNEAENLKTHLHRILNQNYRSYEVLVVNHKSCDNSLDVLASLQCQYSHLRVIECDDERPGKKIALAKGIAQARHQVLLLTDADCVPATDEWLSGMVAGMGGDAQIVLGFAPYFELPGPLNKFIRFEAYYTAIQYLSFALAGMPYMGVGRNLAYNKGLFESKGGFTKHDYIASGDDDLFVNEAARKGNTVIQLDPDTFIYSNPKTTWEAYFRQKRRHFSTGRLYKLHHKALLSTLAMSHWLHYLGGFVVIFKISIIFALLGYAVRMVVVMALSSVILKRLQHRSLWPWLPALDAALIFFYLLFTPAILMNTNTQRWN